MPDTTRSDRSTDEMATGVAGFHEKLSQFWPFGMIAVRVVLGGLLIAHGLDKFDTGVDAVGDQFDMWGVPLPDLSAWFVTIFEVVGGIALILGLATRIAAIVMTLILIGAIIFAKFDAGLIGGYETDLAYIAGLVAIIVLGPGALSVDERINLEPTPTTPTR